MTTHISVHLHADDKLALTRGADGVHWLDLGEYGYSNVTVFLDDDSLARLHALTTPTDPAAVFDAAAAAMFDLL